MLPSELKLASLSHCYAHLPRNFVSQQQNFNPGSIVSVRSVQNDTELFVMWNGVISPDSTQLDLTFAQANNLKDELVVLCVADKAQYTDCSECHVELLDSLDINILSQHTDASVLESCRLIYRGLVIPIFLSDHVLVLVKVVNFEPDNQFGLLTKWTEMHFHHNLEKLPEPATNSEDNQETKIEDPIEIISSNLGLSERPFHLGSLLVCGERGSGKTYYLKSVLARYKRFHTELLNCHQLRGKRPEAVKKKFNELLTEALDKQPSILALDDIDAILASDQKHYDEQGQEAIYRKRLVDIFCNLMKQLERSKHTKGQHIMIIASCQSFNALDPRISQPKGRKFFIEITELGVPNLKQKCDILRRLILDQKQLKSTIKENEIMDVAKKCNSYMASDLKRLMERAIIEACSRSGLEFSSEPSTLELEDLLNSIDGYVPYNLRGVSLQAKSERTMDHVGGMGDIKAKLMKTITLQIKFPKLYRRCPLKKGNSILLYGPPGCGKTLLAEALTNQESINSICVRGPELLSKYIGASEAAVRDLFKRAELARPCIVFFDEFESLVSKRGSDSTGVTDRVVNQFLTLMDGFEKLSSDIFIIGATSRPDMIDPAILRHGRLDKHIYCPMPDVDDRLAILKILSREMTIEKKDDLLVKWSRKLDKFSGADIQSFLYSAQLKALHDIVGLTDFSTGSSTNDSRKTDFEIVVRGSHLEESYREMRQDIEIKFASLETKYPKKIGKVSGPIASRATLA